VRSSTVRTARKKTRRNPDRADRAPSPAPGVVHLRVIPGGAPDAPAEGEGVRSERVRNARARAAVGYYDRPDVQERVIEAVLRELKRR